MQTSSRVLRLLLTAALWILTNSTAQAFYNPSTGRWLSRDPIAEIGGQNLYYFVANEPVRRVDPLGLEALPLPIFLGILGIMTHGGHHNPAKVWPLTVESRLRRQAAFDDIGNRTATKAGGDQYGGNLRNASYTPNSLNQYTSRTVPGYLDIIGSAATNATVTVNQKATYRKGGILPQGTDGGQHVRSRLAGYHQHCRAAQWDQRGSIDNRII